MFSLKRSSELLLAPGLAWHFHHEISSCLPCDSWMNWNGTFSFELGKNMIETNQRHTWSSKTLNSGRQVVVNILQREKKPTTEELDCAVWGVMNGLCEHASSAFIFASSASSKYFRKKKIASSAHFVNFPLRGILLLLKETFCAKKSGWHHSTTDPSCLQPLR